MEKEGLFSYWPQVSWKKYQNLLYLFGSLEKAWRASSKHLQKLKWKPELVQNFFAWRATVDEQALEENLYKQNIRCIGYNNPEYPESLKQIADPPIAIFVRGVLPKNPYIAVVGTRRSTIYGTRVTETLVKGLIPYDVSIVSGLAFGIDASAHRACLDAGGTTIAVLGGSVEKTAILPETHSRLAEKIVEQGGALVSEHPPGYTVHKQSFVIRNRIIAGLSRATLVTEAPTKSGALITAECALESGRDVFAVPHPLYNIMGVGCNDLLRQGAYIALSGDQMAEHLELQTPTDVALHTTMPRLSNMEKQILASLSREPMHIDALSQALSIAPSLLLGALMQMEMKKIVKNTGGMEYIRV